MNQKKRYVSEIGIRSYLLDHRVEGKVVLPAVEVLSVMAKAVRDHMPGVHLGCLKKAVFRHFLGISEDAVRLPVMIEMGIRPEGDLEVTLLTTVVSKRGDIRRTIEHASVYFDFSEPNDIDPPPFRTIDKLTGDCISIPSGTVYYNLIPFGPAYQNLVGDLSISAQGALAYVSGGSNPADEDVLGSPFPLDAVMHMACVWTQRFKGVVTFPVGIETRKIFHKTRKGEEYLGRILPMEADKTSLTFNAWIYRDRQLCEFIGGLQMRDVTNGRLRPPEWIVAERGT